MLKINYPDINALQQFHDDYINIFNISKSQENLYDKFKKKSGINFLPNKLSDILIAPFDNLVSYSFQSNNNIFFEKCLKLLPEYKDYQREIAEFFMSYREKVNLLTCYYCNIDFINAFKDIGDFRNGLDLVKNGDEADLLKIDGIGPKILSIIINSRANITNIDDLKLNSKIKYNLKHFILNKEFNHFTLDHVLHKDLHPLVALSLYNFVPSCYSCNCKFKKEQTLISAKGEEFLSPTYSNFTFNEDVKFKIFLSTNNMKVVDIVSLNDFVLDFNFKKNKTDYLKYLNVFKLKGRYLFHKMEVLKLLNKFKDYSESQIEEISRITGRDVNVIKSDLFGSEIFEGSIENKPFTKLRRDIASNLQIKGVL